MRIPEGECCLPVGISSPEILSEMISELSGIACKSANNVWGGRAIDIENVELGVEEKESKIN
jgi:hypothetical protein